LSTRVEVALPLPIYRTFTYRVDGAPPPVGARVLVPFRGEKRIGWVVGPGEEGAIRGLKSVLDVLDAEPTVSADVLALCRWMADYYVTPLGVALRSALPAVLSDASRSGASPVKRRRVVRLTRELGTLAEREELFGRAGRQREAYEAVEAAGGVQELAHLVDSLRFSRGVVAQLEAKGLVEVVDQEVMRDPFADVPAPPPPEHTLTLEQRTALDALVGALDEREPAPFLLQGVTGSGKTLVYVELLRAALARGRTAIVLVPEISLTPQTVSRFRSHFGDQVAVLHSGLSDGERYDAWRQLHSGRRRIAVGARSALFAPLEKLGAVVVDEEHDGSYKQSEAPRYQARDLAVVRARAHGAVCVLGSATPSLESWHNARTGKFRRLLLPYRVGGARLPMVHVLDLRVARKQRDEGKPRAPEGSGRGGSVLSAELVAAVDERLRRREQVILLLNRRGYAAFVQCRECGEVEQCENCSVSLTFHRTTRRLVCHHCRYEEPEPKRCGRCGSEDLSFRGLGTEQVERIASETFPGARLARMDVDTTSGKWSHQEILGRVERGEVDILLGTQMIAKGLDFPRVTLVGVVNADVGMHLPDFRASERTFQLLSQVAGRSGRGTLGGEVIIQTSLPEHYAVRAAVTHDFEAFAQRELAERERPRYPPHVRLVNVVLSSPDQATAAGSAEAAVAWLRPRLASSARRGADPVELVGPAPAPIEKLHARWRWHFLMRSRSPLGLGEAARWLAEEFTLPPGDVRLALDRDPVALL
jgi:primosomal protein N' (replication factor Y) (superfamily II helicase)